MKKKLHSKKSTLAIYYYNGNSGFFIFQSGFWFGFVRIGIGIANYKIRIFLYFSGRVLYNRKWVFFFIFLGRVRVPELVMENQDYPYFWAGSGSWIGD